jgi:hypothetical protein
VPTYFLRLFKALSLELWLREIEARGLISFGSFAAQMAV